MTFWCNSHINSTVCHNCTLRNAVLRIITLSAKCLYAIFVRNVNNYILCHNDLFRIYLTRFQNFGAPITPDFKGCIFNPCLTNDCHRSATCSVTGNSYTCRCPTDMTTATNGRGTHGCRPNPCAHNQCNRHARCTNNSALTDYTCTCPTGHTGNPRHPHWRTSNGGRGNVGCYHD